MVRDNLIATKQRQSKTNCEIVWIKLKLDGCKSVYKASYYRPKENDLDSFDEFKKSLPVPSQSKGDIWVMRDLNFSKLDRNSEYVPSFEHGCYAPQVYDDFISLLDESNLVQMVTQPTRCENILDLFRTSNHTLINSIIVKPGISDHDLVFSEVLTKPVETRTPRSSYLYRKAD